MTAMKNKRGENKQAAATQLPHAFKHIRLELARSKEFPQGSARHGYDLVAPLDADGRIDPVLWRKFRDYCRVHRFWGGEEETGRLVHKPGGQEHARWVFHYPSVTKHADEAGYHFGAHVFRPAEYVSINDQDGVTYTFRVAAVTAAT